jgi:hypothetical protein
MTKHDKDWMPVGTFGTVTEAARRIVELEGIPKSGLFLEFFVETHEFGRRSFPGFSLHRQARVLRDQTQPTQLTRR